jgi:hypothetical protein
MDKRLDQKAFFTDSPSLPVREIEVFAMTDDTIL